MKSVTIIFPHQLFKIHPAIHTSRMVYLVEETLFFRQYNFHKQKLVLHRASMKMYADWLRQHNHAVTYIDSANTLSDTRQLMPHLASQGITAVHYAETADNWLQQRLQKQAAAYGVQLVKYSTPNFFNRLEDADDYFNKQKKYFQTDFYIAQRKQRNLLLEEKDRPLGGKWSFDADNRLPIPKTAEIPVIEIPEQDNYIKEAIAYVQEYFPENNGNMEALFYPAGFAGAEKWLDDFLAKRFRNFGIYEDAIVAGEHFLYHSVLTPMLNIGLLNPQQIVDKAVDAAIEYDLPLNSLEGFIRQVVGWREFIRIVYEREGSRQRTTNYWGFTRKIPKIFWTGTTGIAPVDLVIKKIIQTGYSHHIERLMVLANFMLLCEFDPNDVYKWFMEMYVDSYDWVMVPNVYGMAQFSDGGLMSTKPYISGSNYLLKMGNFEKGPWQKIWDGLFWRFMHVHRDFFLKNPRLAMLIRTFDKMPAEKQAAHLQNAETFLKLLDEENANA